MLQDMARARRRLVAGRAIWKPDAALTRRRQMARRDMQRLRLIDRLRLRRRLLIDDAARERDRRGESGGPQI
jgi:hypothetical protein